MLIVKGHIEIIHRFMLLCKQDFYIINFTRKKEGLEKEFQMFEKDLEKPNSRYVIMDLTR